jgi:hypothetical protein
LASLPPYIFASGLDRGGYHRVTFVADRCGNKQGDSSSTRRIVRSVGCPHHRISVLSVPPGFPPLSFGRQRTSRWIERKVGFAGTVKTIPTKMKRILRPVTRQKMLPTSSRSSVHRDGPTIR